MTSGTEMDEIDAALQDAVERYARRQHTFDARQKLTPTERRFSATVWRDLAEMGWLGVATGEQEGGLGLRIGSIALLARAAGRLLINEPLLSSGCIAPDILMRHGSPQQRRELLPRLNDGALRVACIFANGSSSIAASRHRLSGRREVVLDADLADALLVQATEAGVTRWYRLDAAAQRCRRSAYPLLDGRGAATVELQDCPAQPLEPGQSQHPELLAALVLAADGVGSMEAAMHLSLEYLKARRQFGVAIGSNQVLQHRAVDMFMRLRECQAVLAQAVHSLQSQPASAARDVHAAKAFVGEQAVLLAQEAVQLHGGIGITEEYALSHHLRRVIVDDRLFGDREHHLGRFVASPFTR